MAPLILVGVTNRQLRLMTGLHEREAQRALARLEAYGCVRRLYGPVRRAEVGIVRDSPPFKQPDPEAGLVLAALKRLRFKTVSATPTRKDPA